MSQSGLSSFRLRLQAPEEVLGVLASEQTSVALRHSQRNAVGSELVTQTKVQASASRAWYSGATRQWLPRLPSRERNSDEQLASQKLRQQRDSATLMDRQSRRQPILM